MEIERKKYNYPFINPASLVDIAFLLLLFFILTSHIIKETASIKIALPDSKTAVSETQDTATIIITGEGNLYLANAPVTIDCLKDEITKAIKNRGIDFIEIKSDRDANVGILVNVIDEVRLAGIKHYSLITERN